VSLEALAMIGGAFQDSVAEAASMVLFVAGTTYRLPGSELISEATWTLGASSGLHSEPPNSRQHTFNISKHSTTPPAS
jgi:hypothetical protein